MAQELKKKIAYESLAAWVICFRLHVDPKHLVWNLVCSVCVGCSPECKNLPHHCIEPDIKIEAMAK